MELGESAASLSPFFSLGFCDAGDADVEIRQILLNEFLYHWIVFCVALAFKRLRVGL